MTKVLSHTQILSCTHCTHTHIAYVHTLTHPTHTPTLEHICNLAHTYSHIQYTLTQLTHVHTHTVTLRYQTYKSMHAHINTTHSTHSHILSQLIIHTRHTDTTNTHWHTNACRHTCTPRTYTLSPARANPEQGSFFPWGTETLAAWSCVTENRQPWAADNLLSLA